jgi:hypothetical protein
VSDASLSALIAVTGQSWHIEDVLSASGGEVDMGGGEKLVGYIARLRDNRRFELRAWRRSDGTLERPSAMQLPSCL